MQFKASKAEQDRLQLKFAQIPWLDRLHQVCRRLPSAILAAKTRVSHDLGEDLELE